MKTINRLAWILALGLTCQPALSAQPYEERKTSIKCGEIEATVVMRCKAGNTEDSFTAGHCITPGKIFITTKNSNTKIRPTPDLAQNEKITYQKSNTLTTLYPRTLSCITNRGRDFLELFYYSNKNDSPYNEIHEFYGKDGLLISGEDKKNIIKSPQSTSKTYRTFVDLIEE